MNWQEYDKALNALGITGPLSDMPLKDGKILLPYLLHNKILIMLPPSDKMTPEQRKDLIKSLKEKYAAV
jgi:hypothetical protein